MKICTTPHLCTVHDLQSNVSVCDQKYFLRQQVAEPVGKNKNTMMTICLISCHGMKYCIVAQMYRYLAFEEFGHILSTGCAEPHSAKHKNKTLFFHSTVTIDTLSKFTISKWKKNDVVLLLCSLIRLYPPQRLYTPQRSRQFPFNL